MYGYARRPGYAAFNPARGGAMARHRGYPIMGAATDPNATFTDKAKAFLEDTTGPLTNWQWLGLGALGGLGYYGYKHRWF